jgi:hypothetical protein
MMVSVMVSIATSPITGAASLMQIFATSCSDHGVLFSACSRRDYPGDIVPRPFHTGRGDNPAADKPAILRQRHFGGGVADINPGN